MNKVGKYDFYVQSLNADFKQRLRLSRLGGYILAASSMNAEENGFGIEVMHENNSTWVASRMCIEVFKYPEIDKKFSVETWVEDKDRIFTTRNFKITDSSEKVIAAASTIWCVLDLDSRRPKAIPNEDLFGNYITGIHSLIAKPEKIGQVKGDPVSRHRVKYSDIDFNGHTNSLKYIEWVMDLLPLDFYKRVNVKRIDINYINEAIYGDAVDIYRIQKSPDSCDFEIRRGKEIIFRSSLVFDNEFKL